MKALTLTQPWASLVALGAKSIETRSWRSAYRGELAIHAAKGFPADAAALCYQRPYAKVLAAARFNEPGDLPTGCIVAVARLSDIIETDVIVSTLGESERVFGDYTAGRWAWLLDVVRPLKTPLPVKGALGLWIVDDALRCAIEAEL